MALQNLDAIETEAERHSRLRTRRHLMHVHSEAERGIKARRNRDEASEELSRLVRRHPEFEGPNFRRVAEFFVLLIGLVGVYLLDCILFAATAQYFAAKAFPHSLFAVRAAGLIVPAAILLVEIVIAVQIVFAREEIADGGSRRPLFGWIVVGVVFALVMPCSVVATNLASHSGTSGGTLAQIVAWQTISLAALAFAAHVGVLFGGRAAHEAKGFVLFRRARRKLQRRNQRQDARSRKWIARSANSFIDYVQSLNQHNAAFTPPLDAGPFAAEVRTLLNDHFGQVVIEAPGGQTTSAPSPVLEVESASPDTGIVPESPTNNTTGVVQAVRTDEDADLENEYLRAILESQVNTAETEVRP